MPKHLLDVAELGAVFHADPIVHGLTPYRPDPLPVSYRRTKPDQIIRARPLRTKASAGWQ
jgi:hypothetical protein